VTRASEPSRSARQLFSRPPHTKRFETNQENHPALLLVNSREGAIEIGNDNLLSDRLPRSGHTLSTSTRKPSRTLRRTPSAPHVP